MQLRTPIVISIALALSASAAASEPTEAFAARLAKCTARGKVLPMGSADGRKIVIDGDLSEWGNLAENSGCLDQQLDQGFGRPQPNQKDAAAFKLLRDSDALYFAIRVVDQSVVVVRPFYKGDCVELFLDTRPIAPENGPKLGDEKYSDGVYQLLLAPPAKEGDAALWERGTQTKPIGPFELAGRRLSDGYSLELRIPFASLGATAERFKQPIGLDVTIDDTDVAPGSADRAWVNYSWGGAEGYYRDASVFSIADPDFKPPLAGGILRAAPARFHETFARRTVIGGLFAAPDAAAADALKFSVNISRTGEAKPMKGIAGDDAPAFEPAMAEPPPQETTETTAYPQLGFTVHRRKIELQSLHAGHFRIETAFQGIPDGIRKTGFDTLAWRANFARTTEKRDNVAPDIVQPDGKMLLPNGWQVKPAGRAIPLPGDMPLRMQFSADGQYLFVNTGGFHDHSISVIDANREHIVQSLELEKTYAGLCLNSAGTALYLSGGNGDRAPILRFSFEAGALKPETPVSLDVKPKECYIAGLAAARDGPVYAVNLQTDTVLRLSGAPLQVQASLKLGYRPYGVALSPDEKEVAVSNWGSESVSLLDAVNLNEKSRVKTGSHPNDLVYGRRGRLFVANSGDNSVSAIDDGKVAETIKTSLDFRDPVGSTPVALAISADGKRLYVANADNNDVAVIDTSEPEEARILGFIPTGWYPSALALAPDEKRLFVGVGKGLTFRAGGEQYIGDRLNGAISVVDIPDEKQLAVYTKEVLDNTPTPKKPDVLSAEQKAALDKSFAGIRHVLYIIRENRTYDQVFGDIPSGNGDPSITMFGEEVTPNAHALAKEFVLLDNLYCNGEVSEDGHQWCDAAYATDFVQKAWVDHYSGHGAPDADERLTSSPGGYLWDNCARHNVTFRSYGEFAYFTSDKDSPPKFEGDKGLEGHASLKFSRLQGDARDTDRADAFIEELHDAEKSGEWPRFMIMSLGEDHTRGKLPNWFTPAACVGSNDMALGKIVDAVSHSSFWKETAILVIEDDAQNGPDHVDAHRTVGLIVSPYTRRNAVDSTFYTTASFIRTIEVMLGLPPMSQYDAAAAPCYQSFTTEPNLAAFAVRKPRIDLVARNGTTGPDEEASAKMDFSKFDQADPVALNAILWRACKGDMPMPAPVRSVPFRR